MVSSRQYLKWEPHSTLGAVYSSGTDCILIGSDSVLLAACEVVHLWSLRSKSILRSYRADSFARVNKLSKGGNELAVGYSDGKIRLFSFEATSCLAVLCGHKSEITALSFNLKSTLLASGGKDTAVIIWDVVNQAGLFRLLGHTGSITETLFIERENFIVTSSKDCLIKFWDLNIQQCTQTIVGHKTEVTCVALLQEDTILVSGSQDAELRFYSLNFSKTSIETTEDDCSKTHNSVEVQKLGSILRSQTNSVLSLKRKTESKNCFYCLTQKSSLLEMFEIRTDEELDLLKKKRSKKLRKAAENQDEEMEIEVTLEFSDHVKVQPTVCFSRVIKSFDLVRSGRKVFVCAGLLNNNIECKLVNDTSSEGAQTLDLLGHRSEVRSICIANDSSLIISSSKETTKVWSKAKSSCIRTIPSGYALCSLVAPGNRHVISGTKSGKLYIMDLGNSDVTNIIDAHMGEVWALDQFSNMKGVISGGSDKCLKFWDYVLEPGENEKLELNLSLARKLDMEEDVLAIKVSSDGKYIAAALLDNSVKVSNAIHLNLRIVLVHFPCFCVFNLIVE